MVYWFINWSVQYWGLWCNYRCYILIWRINKLLLPHNLCSGANHHPLFYCSWWHPYIVVRQTQYHDQNTRPVLRCVFKLNKDSRKSGILIFWDFGCLVLWSLLFYLYDWCMLPPCQFYNTGFTYINLHYIITMLKSFNIKKYSLF